MALAENFYQPPGLVWFSIGYTPFCWDDVRFLHMVGMIYSRVYQYAPAWVDHIKHFILSFDTMGNNMSQVRPTMGETLELRFLQI